MYLSPGWWWGSWIVLRPAESPLRGQWTKSLWISGLPLAAVQQLKYNSTVGLRAHPNKKAFNLPQSKMYNSPLVLLESLSAHVFYI